MPRKIVIGDLHGRYRELRRLLKQVDYSADNDQLFFLGDYVDYKPHQVGAGRNVKILIEDLLKLKNATFLMGNHDYWFRYWVEKGSIEPPTTWFTQGGRETIGDYLGLKGVDIFPEAFETLAKFFPKEHIEFFRDLVPAYFDEDLVLVHGGFENITEMQRVASKEPFDLEKSNYGSIFWGRDFYYTKDPYLLNAYSKIFGSRIFVCGHTARGPKVHKNPTRILMDSKPDKDKWPLHAVVFEGKNYKIYSEYSLVV